MFDPANYAFSTESIGPWIAGLLTAELGLAGLLHERGSRVGQALAFLTTSVAIWLLSIGVVYSTRDEALALWWIKIEHLGVALIPSAALMFTVTTVQRSRTFRPLVWGGVAGSAAFYVSLLSTNRFIAGLYRYPWGFYPRYGPLALPFLIFFFGLLLGSLYLLRVELARATVAFHRRRIRIVLVAFGVAYIGAIDYLAAYGIPAYPIGYVPILGFVVLMVGAVWRYRLLEITPALAADEIVRGIADALLVLDRDGVIRIVNGPASQLLARSAADLIGQPMAAAMGDPFGQDLIDAVAETGLVREPGMAYRTRDGGTLSLDVTGCVTRDRARRPMAFVFILQDLTEYRQLQEQVYEGRKLDAMRRLAGDIARELETNVGLIARRGSQVLRGLDRLAGAHHLRAATQEMNRAADRAADLIDQLLAFGSSQGLKPALLDLNAVVTNLRGMLQWVLGPAIRLELTLDPALGWVNTDPLRTEHVLIKLAAHARDAMVGGGLFMIQTRNVVVPALHPHPYGVVRPGRYVMLTLGAPNWVIDEESQRHVFEPFGRPWSGRGGGLELPAIYGIVKQSGGYIGVDGGPGGGSTFRIYFPIAGAEVARDAERPARVGSDGTFRDGRVASATPATAGGTAPVLSSPG